MTGRLGGSGEWPARDARGNGHPRNGHLAEELLAAYADQELDREPAREVERHLGECAVCEASLRLQHAVRDRLGREAEDEVPAALRARVFAVVRATPPRADAGAERRGPRRRWPGALAAALARRPAWAAAAAVLLVAVLASPLARSWLGREPIAASGKAVPGAGAPNDSLAIVRLIQNHAAAWNARDPDAVASLLTADAVWVTSNGLELRGRERIRNAHVQWLAQDAAAGPTTHVHPAGGITVRFVREDVAVADLVGQFVRVSHAGRPPTVVEEARIFVVAARDGDGWHISHLRNMRRQSAGASPR